MLMKISMKANGTRQNATAMESLLNVMAIILKVTGLTICVRVKDHTSTTIKTNFLLVSGLLISQKMEFTLK